MRLAIFGGTGKTGTHLVDQAIAAGHQVRMLARSPGKVWIRDEKLTVIQGDATDAAAVEKVIDGTDAVISTLGQTKTSPPDLLTEAASHMVAAMKNHDVRRIVTLTGAAQAPSSPTLPTVSPSSPKSP